MSDEPSPSSFLDQSTHENCRDLSQNILLDILAETTRIGNKEYINKCNSLLVQDRHFIRVKNEQSPKHTNKLSFPLYVKVSSLKKILKMVCENIDYLDQEFKYSISSMIKIAAAFKDNLVPLCIQLYKNANLSGSVYAGIKAKSKPIKMEDILDIRIHDILSLLPFDHWPLPHEETSIQKVLDSKLGIKIYPTQIEITQEKPFLPLQFKCTFPYCDGCFHDFKSYANHYIQYHDRIKGLGFFWNDIIAWTRLTGEYASLKTVFSNHYIFRIYYNADSIITAFNNDIYDALVNNGLGSIIWAEQCSPMVTLDDKEGLREYLEKHKSKIDIPSIIPFEQIKEEEALDNAESLDDNLLKTLVEAKKWHDRAIELHSNCGDNIEINDLEDSSSQDALVDNLDRIYEADDDILDFLPDISQDNNFDNIETYQSNIIKMFTSHLPAKRMDRIINILNASKISSNFEYEPGMDIFTFIKFSKGLLPKTGFVCPIDDCQSKQKSVAGIRKHLKTTHGINKYLNQIYHLISKQTDQELHWYAINAKGVTKAIDTSPCIIPNCPYAESHPNWKKHFEEKHSGLLEEVNELGQFWGTIYYIFNEKGYLPGLSDLYENRLIFTCPYKDCCFFSHDQARFNAHFRSHDYPILQNTDAPSIKGELYFLSEQEAQNIIADLNRSYAESGNSRDIIEINDSNSDHTNYGIEEEIFRSSKPGKQKTPFVPESRLRRNNSKIPKVRKPFKYTPDERIAQIKEHENETKILKAKKWIEKYQDLETKGFKTIKLDIIKRKKITKGLESKYKGFWIPLWDSFFSSDWTDEEAVIIIDGLTYKTNHLIRKHISKTLGIDTKIKARTPNTRSIQKENAEIIRNIKCKNNARFISNLAEYCTLTTNGIDNQTTINRLNIIETHINEFLSEKEEKWIIDVFGGTSISNLRDFAKDTVEHRENKLEWIANTLEQEELSKRERSKDEIRKLRNEFRDNPKSTLRKSILPTITPNTKLTANDFAEHYEKAWAYKDINFHPASDGINEEWKIPRIINKDTTDIILKGVTDIELIEDTIKSRRHLSAMGPDGISVSILKLFPECGAQLLKRIFSVIMKYRHVPSSWKLIKTVMIYKKDSPDEQCNWRPIGISSSVYRIFSTLISNSIQNINAEFKIFSKQQKGFIRNSAGCCEHTSTMDEMLHDANRFNAEIHFLTIDFKNAFGSVPHKLFLSIMRQIGLPELLIELTANIYQDIHTYIENNGVRSRLIPWQTGVLQGCPLSPLLFNLCLEPLIRAIHNSEHGYTTQINNGGIIKTSIQAYADDVVFVGSSTDDIQEMIEILDQFCQFSTLELAPNKCAGISNTMITGSYRFRGNEIQIFTKEDHIQYLGVPISGKAYTKREIFDKKLANIESKINTIISSDLTFTQKIYSLQTFLYPKLDYHMLNSSTNSSRLKFFDRRIRGKLNSLIKCPGNPKQFYHLSNKAGGTGLPELQKRANVLKIASFGKLITSNDPIIRTLMGQWCDNEINLRGWDGAEDSPFLNLKITEDGNPVQANNGGSECLLIQTLKAAHAIPISIRYDNRGNFYIKSRDDSIDKEVKITKNSKWTKELNTIIDKANLDKICSLPYHGHTFLTTKDIPTSNSIFKSKNANKIDTLIKFTIRGRTNNLPTPEIFAKKPNSEIDSRCKVCLVHGKDAVESLAHKINGCPYTKNVFTYRHNLIVESICEKLLKDNPRLILRRSLTLNSPSVKLPEEIRNLRPDISYFEGKTCTLIEVTVPYGSIKEENRGGRSTLDMAFDKKNGKIHAFSQISRGTS